MTFRYYILIMSAATLMLTGCGGSDDGLIDEPQNVAENPAPKEITIKTDVKSMQTRANTIDNNTALQGQDIKIDAYYNGTNTAYLSNTKLHYASSWKFWDGEAQLHYYWPIEGSVYDPDADPVSSLDFVGYCPYTAPSYITPEEYDATDGVSFSCDLSDYMTLDDQEDMQEYLIAVLNSQTYTTQTAAGGALPLVFKHPFALIKFTITAASGTNVQINSISIAGLKTGGTCTFDGTDLEWSSLSGNADMTLTQTLKNGGTTEGTPFVVIPNDYGSKTLTVNATWDDWSDVTKNVSASVDFNWAAGYIYTYNLTLDKYALKVDIAKFTEQW